MSQKQKNWVERKLEKIHRKAGDKLISLTKKYVHKIPEDEPDFDASLFEPDSKDSDNSLFKPDSKASGGKIVASLYSKGGRV